MSGMDKGKRRKIFNLLYNKFNSKLKYREVKLQMPDAASFPNAQALPGIYIVKTTELISPLTAKQHESNMGFDVIGVIMATEGLSAVLSDYQDEIEETIMELQHDASFLAIATEVFVESVDSTPVALTPLGLVNPIMPPFAAVRVSAKVLFSYEAFI